MLLYQFNTVAILCYHHSFKYGGLGCSSIFVVVTIISYLFVEETLTEQSASKENKKSKSFSKSSLLLRFEKLVACLLSHKQPHFCSLIFANVASMHPVFSILAFRQDWHWQKLSKMRLLA